MGRLFIVLCIASASLIWIGFHLVLVYLYGEVTIYHSAVFGVGAEIILVGICLLFTIERLIYSVRQLKGRNGSHRESYTI